MNLLNGAHSNHLFDFLSYSTLATMQGVNKETRDNVAAYKSYDLTTRERQVPSELHDDTPLDQNGFPIYQTVLEKLQHKNTIKILLETAISLTERDAARKTLTARCKPLLCGLVAFGVLPSPLGIAALAISAAVAYRIPKQTVSPHLCVHAGGRTNEEALAETNRRIAELTAKLATI